MSEALKFPFEAPPTNTVPLRTLKEAFVLASVKPKLFQPMRSFFGRLELLEGDVPTALASLRGERRFITVGRKFWVEEVCKVAAKLGVDPIVLGVEILFHETWHHLWRHMEDSPRYLSEGYSDDVQGLATDCLINANLHRLKLARFFEGWYEDKPPMAFLRPNSKVLGAPEYGGLGLGRRYMLQAANTSEEEIAAFYGRSELDDELRERHKQHCRFYGRVQTGQATLKDALEFFKNADFGEQAKKKEVNLVGSHGSAPPPTNGQAKPIEVDVTPTGGTDTAKDRGGLNVPYLFEHDEAKRVLEAIGLLSKTAQNNFERVAAEVTTCIQMPGDMRTGVEVLHRMPSRLGRNDLSTLVRGGRTFEHDEYVLRKVTVLIDLSGSMDAYVPFIIALMRKMNSAEVQFEVILWADRAVKVSFQDFIKGNLPRKKIGSGTAGEPVAAYIGKHNISQAVIITDNLLGDTITTRINARLDVCITDGGRDSGGFLDKSIAPNSRSYQLQLVRR